MGKNKSKKSIAKSASRFDAHVSGKGVVCATDVRGQATPGGRSPAELVLDASEGFVPLWQSDVTLRWRFSDRSFADRPDAAADVTHVREIMSEALVAWGSAAPVRFAERSDAWDFQVAIEPADRCNATGCVLASAFFPDAGRHTLRIYPRMLAQRKRDQVNTMAHELGHVFGLRHFFAQVSETAWPSVRFGEHRPFSIMNYGWRSVLTTTDKEDLLRLYDSVWSGNLAAINGTPVRLMSPFHKSGVPVKALVTDRAACCPCHRQD